MKRFWILQALLPAAALAGCGSDERRPPVMAAPASRIEPPPSTSPASSKSPAKSVINISDEIRKACGITDAEAMFDYDSAQVKRGNHPVLEKLAICFKSGPLAGRQMQLVGHADPRGEQEYNLVLGGRRADNVKRFLTAEGLKDAQMVTSSRGEMDAKGTSEVGWVRDRRVDVLLKH